MLCEASPRWRSSSSAWSWRMPRLSRRRGICVAPGALIVREAGGAVSDFSGGRHDLYGEETLASNGAIHGDMLAVLSQPHA